MPKEINLTQGKVAIVDDEDYEQFIHLNWYAAFDKHNWYAVRRVKKIIGWRQIYMHREVMNAPNNMQVDHINHDGLDNRKGNLRLVSRSENLRNKRTNTSGVVGVSWRKDRCKWEATRQIDGKKIHLGYFTSIEDAGEAYQKSLTK